MAVLTHIKHLRSNACGPWFAAALCIFGLMAVVAMPAKADDTVTSEYQVKAAFLINFPKYVEWPAEVFTESNSPIVIAIAGESKISGEVDKMIAGKSVNGRAIIIKRVASGEDPGNCQILFVPAGQSYSGSLSAKLKDASVLTVGESEDFLESGGVINLARRERKIALEINLVAATHARLKISSKLLSVASVVKGKSN